MEISNCIQYFEKQRRKGKSTIWDAVPKHPQTEWVPCSEYWQDIVTTYISQVNDTPIEDNFNCYL